jgi:hypothetical protein
VRTFTKNLSDLLVYILIPSLAVLLPGRASRSIIARCSRWPWILAERCKVVYDKANTRRAILYPQDWKSRWRQVEMLDARDLFLLTFGRKRTVYAECAGLDRLELCRDRVLVGMHWGPSVSILRMLRDQGLKPGVVYRDEEFALLKKRPFLYLWMRLAVREIRHACEGREILIEGAGARLRDQIGRPGTPIVIYDAPPMAGRSVMEGTVMDKPASFHAGFPRLLAESGSEYVMYAISLDNGGRLEKNLDIRGPFTAVSESDFLDRYCGMMTDYLETDTAQWRIWQVADQFFVPASEAGN